MDINEGKTFNAYHVLEEFFKLGDEGFPRNKWIKFSVIVRYQEDGSLDMANVSFAPLQEEPINE